MASTIRKASRQGISEQLLFLKDLDIKSKDIQYFSRNDKKNTTLKLSNDVRDSILLEWDEASNTTYLGLYSKWIIAISVLLEDVNVDFAKYINADGTVLGRLFGFPDPRLRYRLSKYGSITGEQNDLPKKNKKREERPWAILRNILSILLNKFNYLNEKSPEEFFATFRILKIPLSTNSTTVGTTPIEAFRTWLKSGYLFQQPEQEMTGADIEIRQQAIQVADMFLNPPPPQHHHKLIINIYSNEGSEEFALFEKELITQNQKADSAIRPIIYSISFSEKTSRSEVIAEITRKIIIQNGNPLTDESSLSKINTSHDLASALLQVRAGLTAQRVVYIFKDWDNIDGPFSALHEYCCNTNWAELMRALAQPVHDRIKDLYIPYRIVLLSTNKVNELRPWTRHQAELEITRKNNSPEDNGHSSLKYNPASEFNNIKQLIELKLHDSFTTPPVPPKQQRDDLTKIIKTFLGQYESVQQTSEVTAEIKKFDASVEINILKLVAASINGMRRSTLYRCLCELSIISKESFHFNVKQKDFDVLIDQLLSDFSCFIKCVADEDVEGLHYRQLELERRPKIEGYIHPSVNGDSAMVNDTARQSIRFKNRAIRAIFTSAWIADVESYNIETKTNRISWESINYVLAEESLRQATAQMRHVETGMMDNAYTTRRTVQSIYHGLMSLNRPIESEEKNVFFEGRYTISLPTDTRKRFRYLYAFLFRECVEGGAWRLGRAYGRSDVRLDLLTIFVTPGKGKWMMTNQAGLTDITRLLPAPYEPEEGLIRTPSMSMEPLGDPILRCDLLEALGRAGLEQGGEVGRKACEWVLSMMPGWRLMPQFTPSGIVDDTREMNENWKINALLPTRDKTYYRIANDALKLRLDLLQSSGETSALKIAENLCMQQLERLGVDTTMLTALPNELTHIINLLQSGGAFAAKKLERALNAIFACMQKQLTSKAARVDAADILSRLAKILATLADNDDAVSRKESSDGTLSVNAKLIVLGKFALSCATYWLGDRLRSAAGDSIDLGAKWPSAGARNLRYYVRVCLKLARLLVETVSTENTENGQPDPNAPTWRAAYGLMEHAQNRLCVFTRHHFRFKRERVSMLLLESARLVSWCRVNLERETAIYQPSIAKSMKAYEDLNIRIDEIEKQISADRRLAGKQPAFSAKGGRNSNESDRQRTELKAYFKAKDEREKCILLIKKIKSQYTLVLEAQIKILASAQKIADEAEALLLSLGYQATHVRRLCLERVKRVTALVRVISCYPDLVIPLELLEKIRVEGMRQLDIATLSLGLLKEISRGNCYWENIWQRQHAALERAKNMARGWSNYPYKKNA